MADRNEFAVLDEFVTGLFAKFAQCHFLNLPLISIVIIDLARGHFPDGFANRNAFLANEQNFTLARHWRDDHSRFAMYNCPRARLASEWRSVATSRCALAKCRSLEIISHVRSFTRKDYERGGEKRILG